MSDSMASMRRKMAGARDLQSVVRTMKAVSASSITQYESSVSALDDYYQTVELALSVCLRLARPKYLTIAAQATKRPTSVVVFGSDQGLVGQFNEIVGEFAENAIRDLPAEVAVWTVGERVQSRLLNAGIQLKGSFKVPTSANAIGRLVGEIVLKSIAHDPDGSDEFYLFYNHSQKGAIFSPVSQRLLPLDEKWLRTLIERPWPRANLAEVIGDGTANLSIFIREYLFVSIFRACAESLASENASRLSAMQRADKNIDELLEELQRNYHRLRQSGIDEELFDVVSGFEALNTRHR